MANLAYACLHCNRHKGPNLAGLDRRAAKARLVRLFDPRRQRWAKHFRWKSTLLVGRTTVGRVTIEVLNMNDPIRRSLRQQLLNEGRFPVE